MQGTSVSVEVEAASPTPSTSAGACRSRPLNPVFHTLLLGIYLSSKSPLQTLRGNRPAVLLIFDAIKSSWRQHLDWSAKGAHILFQTVFPHPLSKEGVERGDFGLNGVLPTTSSSPLAFPAWFFSRNLRRTAPPPPTDSLLPIHINMMPIIMGDTKSLPPVCARYSNMINRCLFNVPQEYGKVGYLTVHEDFVEEGRTQRRPGVHIEAPGIVRLLPEQIFDGEEVKRISFRWAGGQGDEGGFKFQGGIFMATSVEDSSRVWSCVVRDHESVVGSLGDLDFMRGALAEGEGGGARDLGDGRLLKAGQVVWLTDRTPHESVPVKTRVFRQYFRLVTSQVTGWYERHSTRNELGIAPPASCRIITEDKFGGQGRLYSPVEDSDDGDGDERTSTRPFPSSDWWRARKVADGDDGIAAESRMDG